MASRLRAAILLVGCACAPALAQSFEATNYYPGPFDTHACVPLLNTAAVPKAAKCHGGVSGRFLNFLIARLSTQLVLDETTKGESLCLLVTKYWEALGELGLSCEVQYLEADENTPALLDVIHLVSQTDTITLPLEVTVSDTGEHYYPHTAHYWVRQNIRAH